MDHEMILVTMDFVQCMVYNITIYTSMVGYDGLWCSDQWLWWAMDRGGGGVMYGGMPMVIYISVLFLMLERNIILNECICFIFLGVLISAMIHVAPPMESLTYSL